MTSPQMDVINRLRRLMDDAESGLFYFWPVEHYVKVLTQPWGQPTRLTYDMAAQLFPPARKPIAKREEKGISKSTKRQRGLLQQIHEKYGPRCKRCGFDEDVRVLQIDHVHGGGSSEIRGGRGAGLAYYYRVLRDTTGKYQLLCANCNKIKRHENKEAPGALQHRRPSPLAS